MGRTDPLLLGWSCGAPVVPALLTTEWSWATSVLLPGGWYISAPLEQCHPPLAFRSGLRVVQTWC